MLISIHTFGATLRISLILAALCAGAVTRAADWPMLGCTADRNPVSSEKNAPTDWQIATVDKTARNIKWSVKLDRCWHAQGGPVVANGFVWIGTAEYDPDLKLDNAILDCYRESDGKLVYRHRSQRLPKFPDDWPGQSLSGSPLIEGDRLWFCNNRREVICLDLTSLHSGTGLPRELWKIDMVKEFKIHPRAIMIPGHDSHGSPAAYKDLLFVPTGNGVHQDGQTVPAPEAPSLVCLRKDTGKTVWTDHSPGKDMMLGHYASPLVVTSKGMAQVIHPQADGWVRAFEAETGKLVWKFDTNAKYAPRGFQSNKGRVVRNGVVAAPTSTNGRVFFAAGREPESCWGPGRLFCIDPTKTGETSPELDDGKENGKPNPNSSVIWEFTQVGSDEIARMHLSLSSVAVHDGLVIAADVHGVVHCLEEKTGKRLWFHDMKGRTYGGPLIVDGKLFVATDEGLVFVFELGVAKKLLATHEFDCSIRAPLVFANGTLYVLTDSTLTAIVQKK